MDRLSPKIRFHKCAVRQLPTCAELGRNTTYKSWILGDEILEALAIQFMDLF